jgi:hypothetical protein
MQRIEISGQNIVETYQSIQQRIEKELEIEYIYHTNRLEGSYLMKWATERVLKGIPVYTN